MVTKQVLQTELDETQAKLQQARMQLQYSHDLVQALTGAMQELTYLMELTVKAEQAADGAQLEVVK